MPKLVVVIGGGLGGLSAAIYSRLRGFDVLLLEAGSQCGGKAAPIEIGDYRLDPGPSIIVLTRIYEAVFEDARRRMEDYVKFDRLDPISQVRTEFTPAIDLPASREESIRLVGEYNRADATALRDLLNTLDGCVGPIDRTIFRHPYDRPWQLLDPDLLRFGMRFRQFKTYRALVDQLFSWPLLRAFFYGFPSYGGQSYDVAAPGALLIPYYMLTEGVYYPKGGVAAIPAAFERLAIELGVVIRKEARVTAVQTKGNRVRSLTLADGEQVSADEFVSNVDRSTTGLWLGRKESQRPSLSYFTLHWGLKERIADLRHHTLCIPQNFEAGFAHLYRDRKFPDPPIVYLNATHVLDPDVAPPGRSNLFAVVSTPADEPQMSWSENIPKYRKSVIEQLHRHQIDVKDRQIEFERIQSPRYFAEAHGNYLGSLYGVDERHRILGGLFPHSNRDPEFNNLFYCGGSVQPGAGLPMVTLSGKFAAELIPK